MLEATCTYTVVDGENNLRRQHEGNYRMGQHALCESCRPLAGHVTWCNTRAPNVITRTGGDTIARAGERSSVAQKNLALSH